ncbi:MAG: hypothetical protein RSD00_01195 [Bacilli bacterium]
MLIEYSTNLVRFYKGVDGLKTGSTDNAGKCIIATINKNGMRLISVILGSSSKDDRNEETIGLFEYGFRNYKIKNVLSSKKVLGKLRIDKTRNKYYNYYLRDDLNLLLDIKKNDIKYSYEIKTYNLSGDVNKGEVVGKLILKYNNKQTPYDLVLNESAVKCKYVRNLFNHYKDIISGKI